MQGIVAPRPPSQSLSLRRIRARGPSVAVRPLGRTGTRTAASCCRWALSSPNLVMSDASRLDRWLPKDYQFTNNFHFPWRSCASGSAARMEIRMSPGNPKSWCCSAGCLPSQGRCCLLEVLLVRPLDRLHLSGNLVRRHPQPSHCLLHCTTVPLGGQYAMRSAHCSVLSPLPDRGL